jgi:hypothetical protein
MNETERMGEPLPGGTWITLALEPAVTLHSRRYLKFRSIRSGKIGNWECAERSVRTSRKGR